MALRGPWAHLEVIETVACAWIEPLGTVVWCDDQACKHNHIGMCVMDTVDMVDGRCGTRDRDGDADGRKGDGTAWTSAS